MDHDDAYCYDCIEAKNQCICYKEESGPKWYNKNFYMKLNQHSESVKLYHESLHIMITTMCKVVYYHIKYFVKSKYKKLKSTFK